MNKVYLSALLVFSAVFFSQSSYAHGAGGGDRSYTFEKDDHRINREAEKKSLEKKQDKESWDDFMNAVHEQEENVDTKKDNHK